MAAGTRAVNTSIRMGEDVRDMYEILSQATGRTRNDLMAEALRVEGERQIGEIALIEAGIASLRAGRSASLETVTARLTARGMLPADFDVSAAESTGEGGVSATRP